MIFIATIGVLTDQVACYQQNNTQKQIHYQDMMRHKGAWQF
jgi:hypothetical protein